MILFCLTTDKYIGFEFILIIFFSNIQNIYHYGIITIYQIYKIHIIIIFNNYTHQFIVENTKFFIFASSSSQQTKITQTLQFFQFFWQNMNEIASLAPLIIGRLYKCSKCE